MPLLSLFFCYAIAADAAVAAAYTIEYIDIRR